MKQDYNHLISQLSTQLFSAFEESQVDSSAILVGTRAVNRVYTAAGGLTSSGKGFPAVKFDTNGTSQDFHV